MSDREILDPGSGRRYACDLTEDEVISLYKTVVIASRHSKVPQFAAARDALERCGSQFLTDEQQEYIDWLYDPGKEIHTIKMIGKKSCKLCEGQVKAINGSGLGRFFDVKIYDENNPDPRILDEMLIWRVSGVPVFINPMCEGDALTRNDLLCKQSGLHGPESLRNLICDFVTEDIPEGMCNDDSKPWLNYFSQAERQFRVEFANDMERYRQEKIEQHIREKNEERRRATARDRGGGE